MKLGVIGAQGKMGKQVVALASQDKSIEYTFSLNTKEPQKEIPPLDVIIDFSTKEALPQNLILAISKNYPIVIGTTGFTEKELLFEAAKHIPLFVAPNFSLGMASMVYVTKILSSLIPEFSSHIEETHHTQKKDTPSGSALALKKALEEGNPHNTPSVESFRIGNVIGEHSIFFKTEEESLTLSHHVSSRAVFAKGSLTAAKFLIKQKPGLYSMDDLLAELLHH